MYKELLQKEYDACCVWYNSGEGTTKFEYLSSFVFDFTTYDEDMDETFVVSALVVCDAISNRTTFDYIKTPENYLWYLLLMNTPFFADQTSWGTSIRGAFWDENKMIAGFPDKVDLKQLTKDMIDWIRE